MNNRIWICGLATGLLTLGTTVKAIAQISSTSTILLEREGALTEGDEVLQSDSSLFDRYGFQATQGQVITIDLSGEFDTYLMLLDPSGRKVAENDDISSNNYNSRLENIQLTQSGNYTIMVNGYDQDGSGRYSLTVLEASSDRNSPASTAASSPCTTYVEKLGTSSLTSTDFEKLINCGYEAVPLLKSALNSNNSDVRASAAYALGEIAINLEDRREMIETLDVIEAGKEIESNVEVLTILKSYYMPSCPSSGPFGILGIPGNCAPAPVYRRQVQSQASASSPIICSLPGIRNIFPRCR